MEKKRSFSLFLLLFMFLSGCSSSSQEPNFILTVVAGTPTAAAYQTDAAESLYTRTPTPSILRATITLQPTATVYVFVPTPSNTPTMTPSATRTPLIRTEWPDWKTGNVIKMPSGSGWNIGTNKKFSSLTGLMVMVTRRNGVRLRPIPSKAIGGPMEEPGSAFTLTGVMNKDPERVWLFAQVIAVNGKTYWVGGSEGDENTDPTHALRFYYPNLTASPTPSPTLSQTPTP